MPQGLKASRHWHFQTVCWKKTIIFQFYRSVECSTNYKAIIGSGNGLAPNRQQATAWTNDGRDHWNINPRHAEFI